jgi:hypothetical protein
MSLLEQQKILARLYTDENLRERFFSEPEKTGAENNLTATEIEGIKSILPAEIRFFADSLFYKRLREVEKLLPLTRQVLSSDFETHFRRFASEFLPDSIKKHLDDAIKFCAFLRLQNLEPLCLVDLIRFEQAKLKFIGYQKQFVGRRFQFDVREILEEVSRKGRKTQSFSQIGKRRTVAVWFRLGNKSRHFVW